MIRAGDATWRNGRLEKPPRVSIRPPAGVAVAIATVGRGWRAYDSLISAVSPMTSEQAAQLIDHTLALVHRRLQALQSDALTPEQQALAAEFREWCDPDGGRIDLMLCPGMAGS